jgi:integrase
VKQRLTPVAVTKAQAAPNAERTIIWDTALPGFGLMVTANGHKSFVCQYRANGRSRRYTINSVLGLTDARKEALSVLGKAAKGADPLAARQKATDAAENTLRAVADEYMRRDGSRLRSKGDRQRLLDRYVFPRLGGRQIDSITRRDVVKLLDTIESQNGPVQADHVLAVVRKLFNWHAARSDDFRSPIVRGMARTRPQERRRQRVLSDDELRAVWNAAEATGGPFGWLVRFILLTATRRNEAARMSRGEIIGSDWTIPGSRHKSKRDFLLPMSEAAAKLLASFPIIGRKGLVFTTDGKRPIGGFSKAKREFDKACGVTGWTIHDLRRTARSLMSKAGADPDHAERALGHVLPGIRGTYDVFEYRNEKLRSFDLLASQIGRILSPRANVIALRKAK